METRWQIETKWWLEAKWLMETRYLLEKITIKTTTKICTLNRYKFKNFNEYNYALKEVIYD